jgi:hypothetical protein
MAVRAAGGDAEGVHAVSTRDEVGMDKYDYE